MTTIPSGYLPIPSGVSWTAENGATALTLEPWVYDVRGAPQACPYGVPFSGYIQKWPQQWDSETQRGISSASLVDAWNYVNGNLQPIIIQEILNDGPYAYWPLTDAAGSAQASNQAPSNTNPLLVVPSKYGTGTSSYAFGANSSALLGAQGTIELTNSVRVQEQAGMWELSATSATTGLDGYSLSCTDTNFPPVADGVTVEWWTQILAPQQTTAQGVCVFASASNNARTNGWFVCVQMTGSSEGALCIYQYEAPANRYYLVNSVGGTTNLPGAYTLSHYAMTFNSTGYTLYQAGTIAMSGTWPLPLYQFTNVAFDVPLSSSGFYAGYVAHCAVTPQMLPQARVATHYEAGLIAMTGDDDYARIERLIQASGYAGRRVILQDSGVLFQQEPTQVASCQDISGQPASTSITNIVTDTAPAVQTVTTLGEVFYLNREFTWNQVPKWVLGDRPDLGEIPYEPDDFYIDYDPTRVINDVQLDQLDNQDIVIPQVSQAASQAQYGDITFWQTGYLQGDLTEPLTFGPGLQDLANWIFETNSAPFLRPSVVTVDASANPANWTFVATVNPGDMVTVNRRPPTSDVTLSFTGRVSQTQRSIVYSTDGSAAKVTMTIDPAPEQNALTADSPTNGQLNGVNVIPW